MKKILILTGDNDLSSTNVMKWLYHLDKSVAVIRVNTEELFEKYNIKQEKIDSPIFFFKEDMQFSTDSVSVMWSWKLVQSNNFIKQKMGLSPTIVNRINSNIKDEQNAFFQYLLYNLDSYGCSWLNRFSVQELNKLEQLHIANKIGLKTPPTFLKTKLDNQDLDSTIITKPISDCISINIDGSAYKTFTSKVNENDANKEFLISLFQQEINKELELRVFYLDKKCYTVAILSQSDSQTSVDFRNYNYSNPNRIEYYDLPEEVCEKIELFMEHFGLTMGSLDFILDKQGNYIFLEVNPSGQYGFFHHCNIYPDKLIAEYLLKKHYESNN